MIQWGDGVKAFYTQDSRLERIRSIITKTTRKASMLRNHPTEYEVLFKCIDDFFLFFCFLKTLPLPKI